MREHAKIGLSPSQTSSSSSEYETTDEEEITRGRYGTEKINNVLIKSEWSNNTKAIFSPTAQDILGERIKSRVDVFFSMFPPTLVDTILKSRAICTPAHPEHAHVRSLYILGIILLSPVIASVLLGGFN